MVLAETTVLSTTGGSMANLGSRRLFASLVATSVLLGLVRALALYDRDKCRGVLATPRSCYTCYICLA